MNKSDYLALMELIKSVYIAYGKEVNDKQLSNWIRILNPFPIDRIEMVLKEYMMTERFAPEPVHILQRCSKKDGRPLPAEAWAKALPAASETETVVWTSEMSEAFFACRDILSSGDKYGARNAFEAIYTEKVNEARAAGKPVVWSVSLGTDMRSREIAICDATANGILSIERGASLLGVSVDEIKRINMNVKPELLEIENAESKRKIQLLLNGLKRKITNEAWK